MIRLLPVIAVGIVALLPAARAAAAQDLVPNGDFDTVSDESPPPGWTMWGPQRDKDPSNYTRDTADPHSGAASFRIHHPANTNGYIVSSPDMPVKAQEATKYTVSFWARADRPGRSQFGFTAYLTIAPYVDAPSPGWFTLDVGPEWKRFEFKVSDGLDFYAKRSPLLLLSFKAAADLQEERTLWVDDIVMTAEPVPEQDLLIDETALDWGPLNHCLQPGDRLEVTVDAARRIRPATRGAGGVSFHRLGGWTGQPYDRRGDYTLLPEMEEAIRQMHLPMTRFYAVGEEPFGLEGALDRAAELCGKIAVPAEAVPLEMEAVSADGSLTPDVWARAVRYVKSKGYGFRRWEVGNEVYAVLWGNDTAFATPDDYVAHLIAVSKAVKGVDPDALIGVSVHSDDMHWGNYVLKQAVGHYDFVVPHYYAGFGAREMPFEDVVLGLNYRTLDRVLQMKALVEAYNPGRDAYQYDTEWGLHSIGENGRRADYVDRNANIVGTMHRAVRLIYYVREGMLRGASGWQMLNRVGAQGFGILTQEAPDKRFMLYWLYYYVNRHVGEEVLSITGTAPWYEPPEGTGGLEAGPVTPLVATLSEDGRSLYLIVANGSVTDAAPCTVHLDHFTPAGAEATVITSDDPNGKPLLEHKEDAVRPLPVEVAGGVLRCELPARSVSFITLTAGD
jgi:hypothetical protein